MNAILIVIAQKLERVTGQVLRELGGEGGVFTEPLIYETDESGAAPVAWGATLDVPEDAPRGWMDRIDCTSWLGDVTVEEAARVMGLKKKIEPEKQSEV